MTVQTIGSNQIMPRYPIPLALRIAVRELRGGLKGFYVFVACVALGVAAIAGVGSLAKALTNGIAQQGQELLGGDVALSLIHRQAGQAERSFLSSQGALSEIATLRAMARTTAAAGQALVEIKAVDEAYPLYGSVRLKNGRSLDDAIRKGQGAVVDPLLFDRLKLKIGDTIKIGSADIKISDLLVQEPDRLSGRPAFGPRVMLSIETLKRTGLVQPGSLIRWRYRLKLSENTIDDPKTFDEFRKTLKTRFSQSGFNVQDRSDPAPNVRRAIERLTQFLTLVGLTALLVGGVGVANAVATFIDQRRQTIATFKCLGAPSSLIISVYLVQVLMLAGLGVAFGLIIGTVAPLIVAKFYGAVLPVSLAIDLHPAALISAAAYGFVVALLFIVWPLGRARHVRPRVLMRDQIAESPHARPYFAELAIIVCLALLLAAVAIFTSQAKYIAIYFCIGLLALFAIFLAFGVLLQHVVRQLPRPRRPEFALAFANIAGPGTLVRSVVLSLGAGLSLLVAVALVDHSLVSELKTNLPGNAPSYFFLDIGKEQETEFSDLVIKSLPQGTLTKAPMLRGRIVRLAGKPAEKIKAPPNAQWVLNGDRGLTYSETLPEGSELVAGEWWSKAYAGEPLVSFEAEIAKALKLKLGDTVTINVLGRDITARMANFRTVKWESLAINFVMVFSPNTLAGAPVNLLATLHLPRAEEGKREGVFMQKIAETFPNITAVRVRDAIDAVRDIFGKLMLAVRAAGSLALLAGVLVLAGALATAQRRRIYEAVILKTLGATRVKIIAAHFVEYLILALVTSVLAIGLGALASALIVTQLMDLSFSFSLLAVLQAVVLAVSLVVIFGGAGSWRVLSAKTVPHLRAQ